MTQAALHALNALALCTPINGVFVVEQVQDLKPAQSGVLAHEAAALPAQGPLALPVQEPSVLPEREQVRKLVHSLAASALLACSLCAVSASAAVAVTPLSEEVFSTPVNNVTLPADKRPGGLQTGPLIPLEEWKRYCNRPNALGPHPQGLVAVAEVSPNGATGYVRDPAYLPVLPMTQSKATKTRSKKSAPPVSIPVVTSPVVPGPMTPTVASPTTPSVAAPSVVTSSVAKTGAPTSPTAGSPYSATAPDIGPVSSPASPANPASPAVPPAASPSLAAQSPAQDGVMATGRGIVSDMASKAASAMNAGSTTAAENVDRRPFIAGQASTLVVPPEGISLQPNNGSGALTAPANPQ